MEVEPIEADSSTLEITMEEWYQVCRERPDAFAHFYFPHILRAPSSELHFLLYDLIRKIDETEYSNHIAIAAPRGNAKTQIMSIILPIWCVAFETKKFIMLISETGRLAEANLESIKHELQMNELLADHFPQICGEGVVWRKEVIDTGNGIRIAALGSGKQIRGHQKKGGHRPDLVLCHPMGTKILGVNNNIDVAKLKVGDKIYNHKWEEDSIVAWKPYIWEGDYYKFKLYGHPEEIEATAGHKFFVRKKGNKEYIRTGSYMKCLDKGKWKRNQYRAFYTYAEECKLNVREIEKGDMVGFRINTKIFSIEEIAKKEGWKVYRPGSEIKRNSKGRIIKSKGSYQPVNVDGKERWLKSKEFLYLCGVYLGDGTVVPHGVVISTNSNDVEGVSKITTCAERIGMTYHTYQTDKNVIQIKINSKLFSDIVSVWKKDKNSYKVPTRSIEFLDPELQRELILGYIAADGWCSEKQGVKITSVCLELLEFMQRILLRQGIIASIRKGIKARKTLIKGKEVNCQDKYDLYFKQDAWKLGLLSKPETERYHIKNWFIEDNTVWKKVKSINSEYKIDTVYPFTVEKEHTYLTSSVFSPQCDDIESDESVKTKGRRDDLEDWFTKAVMGMKGVGDTKMDVIVVGTILHPTSLLSKLLDPKKFPGWKSHKYKAVYAFSKSPLWKEWEKIYINQENENNQEDAQMFFDTHKDAMLEGTKVLWPEGDSYYNLMKYRIDSGKKSFSSEKQNEPLDPSQTLFDLEKIVYFDLKDVDINKLIIYGAVDPASGDAKKKGDLSVVITLGKDPKSGILYVLDVMADDKSPSQCIQYIKEMHHLYFYKKFGVDNDALKIFKEFLEKEVPDLIGRLTLYDLRLNKQKRIDRLEPVVHSGIIRIQKNQYELIDELEMYPNVEHDDALDALEIAVRLTGHRGYRLLTY